MKIRDKVSKYFGRPINTGSWQYYFDALNAQGKITARATVDLLVLVFEHLDETENITFVKMAPEMTPEEKLDIPKVEVDTTPIKTIPTAPQPVTEAPVIPVSTTSENVSTIVSFDNTIPSVEPEKPVADGV